MTKHREEIPDDALFDGEAMEALLERDWHDLLPKQRTLLEHMGISEEQFTAMRAVVLSAAEDADSATLLKAPASMKGKLLEQFDEVHPKGSSSKAGRVVTLRQVKRWIPRVAAAIALLLMVGTIFLLNRSTDEGVVVDPDRMASTPPPPEEHTPQPDQTSASTDTVLTDPVALASSDASDHAKDFYPQHQSQIETEDTREMVAMLEEEQETDTHPPVFAEVFMDELPIDVLKKDKRSRTEEPVLKAVAEAADEALSETSYDIGFETTVIAATAQRDRRIGLRRAAARRMEVADAEREDQQAAKEPLSPARPASKDPELFRFLFACR